MEGLDDVIEQRGEKGVVPSGPIFLRNCLRLFPILCSELTVLYGPHRWLFLPGRMHEGLSHLKSVLMEYL